MDKLNEICKLTVEKPSVDELLFKIASLLSDPEIPPWATVIDSSAYARVCSFVVDGKNYLFKLSFRRNLLDCVKSLFVGTRSEKAVFGSKLFFSDGLLAPSVICYGSGGTLGAGNSFIVTEFIESEFNVATFLRDITDVAKRANMLHSLGGVIGLMHSKNLTHGDLRPGNVLIVGEADSFKFYFIDNERNKHTNTYEEGLVVTNLVQLNMLGLSIVSKEERFVFYDEYCKVVGLSEEQSESIKNKVWTITESRMSTSKLGGLYN